MNKPIKFSTEKFVFEAGTVLHADQLNTITYKVDQIIDYLPDSFASQSDTQQPTNPSDTQTTDTTKLTELENYLALLENSNKNINKSITDLYNKVQNLASGNLIIDNKEQFARGIIDSTFAALLNMQLLKKETIDGEEVYSCAIDLAAINKLTGMASFLEILPGSAGLIATNFEQNSSGEWVPKYDGARIIASINESGNSAVKISADFINLEGYVKTSELEALNITANDTLTGVHIKGGDINIGNGAFVVDSDGHVTANDIIMSGQGHWITMEESSSVTLPDARPGSSVMVFNRVPTASGISYGEPHYRTINSKYGSAIKVWTEDGRRWSNEGSSLTSWISSRIVYANFISDGKDWYMIDYRLCDGQTI